MYLDFKVKIPYDAAGITRKKIKGSHIFIMRMNIITILKKDIRFPGIHPLGSVRRMIRK
mgnify:CR=1 FL=1